MRGLLGRLGLRGGAAVGLILLVLLVVAIARLAGGGTAPLDFMPGSEPSITVNPTEGDDGEVAANPTEFPDGASVTAAATTFTASWLRRDLDAASWHAGLTSLATASLADSLIGVDPAGVPATRRTGDPTITLRTELFAQVAVPLDSGRLLLTLVKEDDGWLVDGVDWERA